MPRLWLLPRRGRSDRRPRCVVVPSLGRERGAFSLLFIPHLGLHTGLVVGSLYPRSRGAIFGVG